MNQAQPSDSRPVIKATPTVQTQPQALEQADLPQDLNRDPLTGKPGSHPVGTALGSAGAAAAGAAVGAMFGPIGFMLGGTLGAIAGGVAGHVVAEQVDPTGEVEFWRGEWRNKTYYDEQLEFDQEYAPAFLFGVHSYGWLPTQPDGNWDRGTEQRLEAQWEQARGPSSLSWSKARQAVRDAWERTHQTHRTYKASDDYWRSRVDAAPYYGEGKDFDRDYRVAYRYGTYARSRYFERAWDSEMEAELQAGWPGFCGACTLSWELAMPAVKDGFDHAHLLDQRINELT